MSSRRKARKKSRSRATAATARQTAPLRLGAWAPVAALGLLLLLTAWAYSPVLDAAFINFDDGDYVYNNPAVRAGLTLQGAAWAFVSAHASNYHPLTWISHMLDAELFGMDAGAHHAVNLALHLGNVALLFWFLAAATSRRWAALAVAGLWALHPLHVESVAWVSERKDVLSTLFFLGTLLAWVWYARSPGVLRYLAAFALLALGLLAKPMLVTTPCLLLILDWWPLGRFRSWRHFGRLLLEKTPLFALAAGSALATLWAQGGAGAMASLQELPLAARVLNLPVACVTYVWKTFWPTDLGLLYPFVTPALWLSLSCLALLLAATAALWRWRRTAPWGLAGWLWFLGTLAPVSGVIQVGGQAWADRYSYIPHMGLFILLVWGADRLAHRLPREGVARGAATALVCFLLAWGAHAQAARWQDSERLYRHTLEVTENNYIIQYNLAVHYREQGRWQEAVEAYEAVLETAPGYYKALNNLAYLLAAAPSSVVRDPDRALELARRALAARGGDDPAVLDTLAAALAASGRFEEAVQTLARAAAIARRAGLQAMAGEIESRLPLYREKRLPTLE